MLAAPRVDGATAPGPRRRGGGQVRRDAGPWTGTVELVGVHGAATRLAGAADRPARRRPDGAGDGRGGRRAHRRAPRRHVHRPGRGRRPPPDRGGEGARARRQHRGPADHRPARLHRRPPLRPGGDAPRDLPARAPAGHPADQAAARAQAGGARLPPYGPRVALHRRRPDRDAPPAQAAAPHRARHPVRRQRLGRQLRAVHAAAVSSRCASSSTRCARSRSSTPCTR